MRLLWRWCWIRPSFLGHERRHPRCIKYTVKILLRSCIPQLSATGDSIDNGLGGYLRQLRLQQFPLSRKLLACRRFLLSLKVEEPSVHQFYRSILPYPINSPPILARAILSKKPSMQNPDWSPHGACLLCTCTTNQAPVSSFQTVSQHPVHRSIAFLVSERNCIPCMLRLVSNVFPSVFKITSRRVI